MTDSPPSLSSAQILDLVKLHYNLSGELSELPSYIDLNRLLVTSRGKKFVVKIANAATSLAEIDLENKAMMFLEQSKKQLNFATPEVILSKSKQDIVAVSDDKHRVCFFRVISFIDGELWGDCDASDISFAESLGQCLGRLNKVLSRFEHESSRRFLEWDIKLSNLIIRQYMPSLAEGENRSLVEQILNNFETKVGPKLATLPHQIIHNDVNDYNIMVNQNTKKVNGIFDFGDMIYSIRIAELAIAGAYAIIDSGDPESVLAAMTHAYHCQFTLTEDELDCLLILVKTRLAVSVCKSTYAYANNPDNNYLVISQQGAWRALHALNEIDELSFTIRIKARCLTTFRGLANQDIIDYRRSSLSENLSLAYQEPIKIIAGKGAYLYDSRGHRYLDMVNNVCHVGHCHPKVVSAGQKQMALLNTNTRYLHDNIVRFSQKLLETFPQELSVCFLVNSGSEANELALRLARKHTKSKNMIVVEGAYHGNTNACIDISPYKHNGKGGEGAPNWVKAVAFPDSYRGTYRGFNSVTGLAYAEDVAQKIKEFENQEENSRICGFICESIQGVGGQVFNPPGYLKAAYEMVRRAGGVCIADEVQVGMGRVGNHWWAFQSQDVIPDIVTIGKPLGNGHPLAAVVTTKEIADSFVDGMEYFNTFGGNPVSCAIGEAVIDVIQEEGLLEHAASVGQIMREGLLALKKKHSLIGDVRGEGLFMGVEFVTNRETLEPATEHAEQIIEKLKIRGILLTTEGPYHNVLKIKPPLAFSDSNADYFIRTLDNVLDELSDTHE